MHVFPFMLDDLGDCLRRKWIQISNNGTILILKISSVSTSNETYMNYSSLFSEYLHQ